MPPKIRGHLDRPQDGEPIDSELTIRGWAMCPGEVVGRVEAFLAGESIGLVDLWQQRADVQQAHPQAGLMCGFEKSVPLPAGRFADDVELEVVVSLVNGRTRSLPKRQLKLPPRAQGAAPRVLLWARGLEPGGSQLRMLEQARQLRGLGAELVVASPVDGMLREPLEEIGATVEIVSAIPFDDIVAYDRALNQATAWAAGLNLDVIVSPTVTGFPSVEVAQLIGARSWLRIGEYEPVKIVAEWLNLPMCAEVELRAKAAIAMADVVQTRDLSTREAYQQRGWTGAFELHREGTKLPTHMPDPGVVRRQLGLTSQDRLVVCAGSIWQVKGQGPLLDAFAAISDQHPNLRIVCIGQNVQEYGVWLLSEIERRGLEERFQVLPFEPDIGPWLAACDALVSPSTSEALSASILEAMAYGKPVIGSAVGGTPELVIDGKTGWLYPDQDITALSQALAEVATAPAAKLRKMGRRGRRLIERDHDQTVVLPAMAKAIVDLAARG